MAPERASNGAFGSAHVNFERLERAIEVELSLRAERYQGKPLTTSKVAVFNGRGGSIGRSPENFMVLPDPKRQISGRHAFILLRGNEFYIVDTGQNGVYLNNSSKPLGWCRTAKLEHGSSIIIGDYLLKVSISDAPVAAPKAKAPRTPRAKDKGNVPPAAPVATAKAEATTAKKPPPSKSQQPKAPSADVLVVDDDEDISYLVKFMLERAGYSVTLANDGLAAKEVVDTATPTRLVVLDVMLPHFDGFQLIDEIRNHVLWREVPVVMLSAMTGEREIIRALNAGANDYVEKPFKPAELVARLKRFLG